MLSPTFTFQTTYRLRDIFYTNQCLACCSMVNVLFPIIAGLPVIQRSFVNPLRYTSPPLPQIKTSLYEEDQTQENETMLSCHSSLSPSNHVSENGILAFNYQISNLQLPASIHQDKNEIEEIEMVTYTPCYSYYLNSQRISIHYNKRNLHGECMHLQIFEF